MHQATVLVHTMGGHMCMVGAIANNTVTDKHVTVESIGTMDNLISNLEDVVKNVITISNHVHVEVHTRFPLSQDIQDQLLHYAESGMDVTVQYYGRQS